jgi:hypothetical protein
MFGALIAPVTQRTHANTGRAALLHPILRGVRSRAFMILNPNQIQPLHAVYFAVAASTVT